MSDGHVLLHRRFGQSGWTSCALNPTAHSYSIQFRRCSQSSSCGGCEVVGAGTFGSHSHKLLFTMRVIAGIYRSRPIRSLKGMEIRPTSDRLRETLFNVLTAGHEFALAGATFFDLYAGTGAVGIEALSRGAAQVVFVESSPQAVSVINQNLNSLGVTSRFHVIHKKVSAALREFETSTPPAQAIFFLDPPYQLHSAYEEALGALADSSLVSETSEVIAEHDRKFDPGDRIGRLHRYRKLEQGDAALSFYRLS